MTCGMKTQESSDATRYKILADFLKEQEGVHQNLQQKDASGEAINPDVSGFMAAGKKARGDIATCYGRSRNTFDMQMKEEYKMSNVKNNTSIYVKVYAYSINFNFYNLGIRK